MSKLYFAIFLILLTQSARAFDTYQPEHSLLMAQYDSDQPLYDLELTEDLSNQNQYAITMWLRWSRTDPKYLQFKQSWHSIARVTSNKDHNNHDPGDRALAIWLGNGFFHFTTYTKHNPNVFANMDYNSLDSVWHFIYYSYKRVSKKEGQAQAFLYPEWQSASIKATHSALKDYLRVVVQSEFKTPLFNGYYANLQVRVGDGAYVEELNEAKKVAEKELALPAELQLSNKAGRFVVLDQPKEVEYKEPALESDFEIEETRTEYSIAGWARWKPISRQFSLNQVARLYVVKPTKGVQVAGDRCLSIMRAKAYYQFGTYTTDEKNDAKPNLYHNFALSSVEDQVWSYFYFGYTRGKAFAVVRFHEREEEFLFKGIMHFVSGHLRVNLQKNEFLPGFNGAMKKWVVNVGEGSYRERLAGSGEQFFYEVGHAQYKGWQREEVAEEAVEVELVESEDTPVNGVAEYGLGFWSRFQWNSRRERLHEKGEWTGLARVATNREYGSDDKPGDRTLAVFLGRGFYQFGTYSVERLVRTASMPYGDDLDSNWVYIYFSYARQRAVGWHLYEKWRKVEIGDVHHRPVTDYLFLSVGSVGALSKNVPKFNGQIAAITLSLGPGAFIADVNKLNQLSAHLPEYPHTTARSQPCEEEVCSIDHSEDADEYAVELWFRALSYPQKHPLEWLYSLVDNEANARPGNAVLSLQSDSKHALIFKSYAVKGDSFSVVTKHCQVVNAAEQMAWMYSYFGYSKKQRLLYFYLQTKDSDCRGEIEALHRVPAQLWCQLHPPNATPFHGKTSFLTVSIGQNAFQSSDFELSPVYTQGLQLGPKKLDWTELQASRIAMNYEESDVVLQQFAEEIDAQTDYAFGFWSKYMTGYPARLLHRPDTLSMARMAQADHTVMWLLLAKSAYRVQTYSAEKTLSLDLPHPSHIEGQWNYLYLCYSTAQLNAFAIIDGQSSMSHLNDILHHPLDGTLLFKMGAQQELGFLGFNGVVTSIVVRFHDGSFIQDLPSFNARIVQVNPSPLDPIPPLKVHKFDGEDPLEEEFSEEDYADLTEYSIAGWFKPPVEWVLAKAKPQKQLMSLTQNGKEVKEQQGEQTLTVKLQRENYVLSTYSVKSAGEVYGALAHGANFGTWTYFYMGYRKSTVVGFMKSLGEWQNLELQDVVHIQSSYFRFECAHVSSPTLSFGQGSFVPDHELLQNTNQYGQLAPSLERFDDATAQAEEKAYLLEDVNGASEYAFALWTRWLFSYPPKLAYKLNWHSLLRLSNTRRPNNQSQWGDRLLATFLAKGSYYFTTGDAPTRNPDVHQEIPYGRNLEGNWNFIYFAYKHKQGAAGYVYFSELDQLKSIRFPDVQHGVLIDVLRVSLGGSKFGFTPFNGQIYGLNVKIQSGYIDNEEDLKLQIVQQKKPDKTVVALKSIKVDKDSKMESEMIEEVNFAEEYSVEGWVRFGKIKGLQKRVIFRLTTNEVQKDIDLGDRALAVFQNEDSFKFGTYSLQDVDLFDNQKDNHLKSAKYAPEMRFEWNYIYFGYNFSLKKAFGLVKKDHHQLVASFEDIYHVLPLNLYLFLGTDGVVYNYDGALQGFVLHYGSGSYTEKPEEQIISHPPILLSRQQYNQNNQ